MFSTWFFNCSCICREFPYSWLNVFKVISCRFVVCGKGLSCSTAQSYRDLCCSPSYPTSMLDSLRKHPGYKENNSPYIRVLLLNSVENCDKTEEKFRLFGKMFSKVDRMYLQVGKGCVNSDKSSIMKILNWSGFYL